MQNYYYQVLIDGKVFPYEGCKIWNKESAEVYLKQAETIVKTHVDYKYKNCKVELVRYDENTREGRHLTPEERIALIDKAIGGKEDE